MLKFMNIVMFVLFVIAMIVQYNDPDPWLWIAVYFYGAVVTFFAIRDVYTPFAVVGAVAYVGGFFYQMPDSFENWYTTEVAREALGMLFVGIWMTVLSAKYFRNLQTASEKEAESTEPAE
jgi:hypothetical protein